MKRVLQIPLGVPALILIWILGTRGTWVSPLVVPKPEDVLCALISQVTFDVFQFCRDLDLASIRVGCRHIVNMVDEQGNTVAKEDTTLFKIRIDRDDLLVLHSDPFVNKYSTSDHFQIEVDEFPTLSIETEQR